VGFLARHPASAYSRETSCAECHNTRAFCADCHREAGLSARGVLQAGYPVIVDAAFLRQSDRAHMHAVAQALGVPFTVLHCRAGEPQLQARVQSRLAAGGDPSEAGLAVLAAQQRTAEPLTAQEQALALTVNTDAPWNPADLARQWRAAATGTQV